MKSYLFYIFISFCASIAIGCLNPAMGLILFVISIPIIGILNFFILEEDERKKQLEKEQAAIFLEKRNRALNLVRKYPEAVKYFFREQWGIVKPIKNAEDLTEDIIIKLLSYSEIKYANKEREIIYAPQKEVVFNLIKKYPKAAKCYLRLKCGIEKPITSVNDLTESVTDILWEIRDKFERKEELLIRLEKDKEIVLDLIIKYPEATRYYFETYWYIKKEHITCDDINTDAKIIRLASLKDVYAEENARQRRLISEREKREKDLRTVLYYVRQYPEATKYYFKLHWGITKMSITEQDVTYDKVQLLLSHLDTYYQDNQRIILEARIAVMNLIDKYPLATKYYFKQHWNTNKRVIKEEDITPEVVSILYSYKDTYAAEEKRLDDLLKSKRVVVSLIRKYPHAARFYFKKHWNISKPLISSADVSEDKIPILLRYKDNFSLDNFIIAKQEEKREIVLDLVSKYPYASRFYFKKHWSITKSHINDTDITDDKIETLLSYQNSYADEDIKQKRIEDKSFVLNLVHKYPEATKYYFKFHWGLIKTHVADYDITDDKIDTLLSHRYTYEDEERRQVNIAKEIKKKEEEARILANLHSCVSSWGSHSNSNIKHKYFFSYYPYHIYKDNTSSSMRDTWRTVWNFKNDPDKNVSAYEHQSALETVTDLVENTLRSAFGSKTEYLTLVCLTASTQRKTELRYKDFAEQVCKDLNMHNAYPHIQVIEGGSAKHDGGDGSRRVSYDRYFFNGKYIVLFDDVRTTGHSLEQERRTMEELGAKVICAVTIAQTAY